MLALIELYGARERRSGVSPRTLSLAGRKTRCRESDRRIKAAHPRGNSFRRVSRRGSIVEAFPNRFLGVPSMTSAYQRLTLAEFGGTKRRVSQLLDFVPTRESRWAQGSLAACFLRINQDWSHEAAAWRTPMRSSKNCLSIGLRASCSAAPDIFSKIAPGPERGS